MATRAQTRKRKSPDQEGDTEHRDNPTSSKRIKRTEKATDSIPWEVFYMSVAALEAQRSNCLDDKKAGACIINPEIKKIVAVGHNYTFLKQNETVPEHLSKEMKNSEDFNLVSYAAINAILNKSAEKLDGCIMYMTKCPKNEEAKVIIQAGIKKVIYFHKESDKDSDCKHAKKLLADAKVTCKCYSETSTSLEHPSIVQPVFPYVDNKHPSPQPQERPDHPDYDKDHFMAIACLAFQRSKDPNRKVGACIVDRNKKIVGIGYNGFPIKISDDDPTRTWGQTPMGSGPTQSEEDKYKVVVHAEVNAIMFRNCVDLEGCTLYTTLFPCHECAKAIIWSGIKEIYYLTDYQSLPGSFEWDDPNVDDNWVENKDKPTYVASRYLLQKFYTSGKHQKVELMNGRICKRYIPSRRFAINLQGEQEEHM